MSLKSETPHQHTRWGVSVGAGSARVVRRHELRDEAVQVVAGQLESGVLTEHLLVLVGRTVEVGRCRPPSVGVLGHLLVVTDQCVEQRPGRVGREHLVDQLVDSVETDQSVLDGVGDFAAQRAVEPLLSEQALEQVGIDARGGHLVGRDGDDGHWDSSWWKGRAMKKLIIIYYSKFIRKCQYAYG